MHDCEPDAFGGTEVKRRTRRRIFSELATRRRRASPKRVFPVVRARRIESYNLLLKFVFVFVVVFFWSLFTGTA